MSAVSEIAPARKPVTIDINSTALDVAKLMVRQHVGSVIVIDAGSPAGIITERDILKKVSAHDMAPGKVAAKSIMSSPVITAKVYDSIETAAAIMAKNGIKRLAIAEQDGSLSGMLSVSDITKSLSKILVDDYNRYGSLKAMFDED